MKVLKDFQVKGVSFLVNNFHAILADDMGLGKTLQVIRALDALATLECKDLQILIIVPSSVKIQWENELTCESTTINPDSIQILTNGKSKIKSTTKIIIVSYTLIRNIQYLFANQYFDILICDEAHFLKKMTSERTKAILGNFGVARKCKYKWFLTGTPIANQPIDLFPILFTLFNSKIKPYDTYEKFAIKFNGGYTDHFGFRIGKAKNKEMLHEMLIGSMLRRIKEDVVTELLPLDINIVSLSKTEGIQKILEKENNTEVNMFKSVFGDQAALRQQYALEKLPIAIEYIEEKYAGISKLLIFVHHMQVLEKVSIYYNSKQIPFAVIKGDMTAKEKTNQLNFFINDTSCKILIASILTANVGLDGLQKVCSNVVFIEWSWQPSEVNQAIDRLHRIGQHFPVSVEFLVIPGTIEERMLKSVNLKEKASSDILTNLN